MLLKYIKLAGMPNYVGKRDTGILARDDRENVRRQGEAYLAAEMVAVALLDESLRRPSRSTATIRYS